MLAAGGGAELLLSRALTYSWESTVSNNPEAKREGTILQVHAVGTARTQGTTGNNRVMSLEAHSPEDIVSTLAPAYLIVLTWIT